MNTITREINKQSINLGDTKKYFKQISINDKIKFCEYVDEKYMKFKCASLHLQSIKLINTIKAVSYEGCRLSGKEIILCGYVEISFFVDYKDKCFYIKKDIPLSTVIVVSEDILEEDLYEIHYCIEDVTLTNIEYNIIFICVTLYIEYVRKDNYTNQFYKDDDSDSNKSGKSKL